MRLPGCLSQPEIWSVDRFSIGEDKPLSAAIAKNLASTRYCRLSGHTLAVTYSVRTRTTLPASTPVSWTDLETIDAPEDLNYSSLPGPLATSGDPSADIGDFARDLHVHKTGK
jgi:hypothetical protein